MKTPKQTVREGAKCQAIAITEIILDSGNKVVACERSVKSPSETSVDARSHDQATRRISASRVSILRTSATIGICARVLAYRMSAESANPLLLGWIKELWDVAKERNSKGATT